MKNIYKFKKNGKSFLQNATQLHKDYTGHITYSTKKFSSEFVNQNGDTLDINQNGVYLNEVKINNLINDFWSLAESQLKSEYALNNKKFDTCTNYTHHKMATRLAVELYLQNNNK